MTPLTDSFGRAHTYLRISVTDRCNLRCGYCMPPGGVPRRPPGDILAFEEIERVARIFARLGIDKIRLTGGEPLLRADLPELVARLTRIEGVRTVALTTNGLLLCRNAAVLKEAGLPSVNVSLDTLRPERFEAITFSRAHAEVLRGIDAAVARGFAPVKLNMVVMGGVNDDELGDFVELTRSRPVHVRFIEFMPFRANGWRRGTLVPYAAMRARLDRRFVLVPDEEQEIGMAKLFRVGDWPGRVGFITPMSDHFCDGCDRIRLTADGSVKSCLFSPAEVNLRAALRYGAEDSAVETLIRSALMLKPSGHPAAEDLAAADNRSMIEIGG